MPERDWYQCDHEWKDVESMSDRGCICTKCGCPGERNIHDDEVYWPAT